MPQQYQVALIGNKTIRRPFMVQLKLIEVINSLIAVHPNITFFVGVGSGFGEMAAAVCGSVSKKHGKKNYPVRMILPGIPKKIAEHPKLKEDFYKDCYVPLEAMQVHPMMAVHKRNQWMVDNCRLLIGYAENDSAFAATAFRRAKEKNLPVINLYTLMYGQNMQTRKQYQIQQSESAGKEYNSF